MLKRTHRNKTRLTALERAKVLCRRISNTQTPSIDMDCAKVHPIILRALQAHARQALARDARRRDKDLADYIAKVGGDQGLTRERQRQKGRRP